MNQKTVVLSLGIFFSITSLFSVVAQSKPEVLGKGLERFEVGAELYRDDFDNLDQWVVQVEQRDGFPEGKIEAKNQALDCRVPGRGCTVWFKKKLQTRLAITYDVVCPVPKDGTRGLQPKDVNNFWLASDPEDPEAGLFDAESLRRWIR